MADRIESNIILQTQIPQPQGDGFGRVHSYLEKLDKKLQKITGREYTLKINFDESALNQLGVTLKRKIDDAARKAGVAGGVTGGGSGSGTIPSSPVGGELTQVRRSTRQTKKGVVQTTTGTVEESGAGVNRITKTTEDAAGNVIKTEETEVNVAAKERATQRKRDEKKKAQLEKEEQDTNRRREAAEARLHLNTTLAAQEDEYARTFAADAVVARDHLKSSLKQLDDAAKLQRDQKNFQDATHNRASRRDLRQRTRQLQADDTLSANRRTTRLAVNEAIDAGFQEQAPKLVQNRKTGGVDEILRFQRVTGNVLSGYRVDVLEANVEQGKFNATMLEGAAASRKMGDSFGHAIAKVGLWAGATTLVFAAARGLGQAAVEVTKLEESTVLLARVGNNLGSSFSQRSEAAKRLTTNIVEQTTAIGGNAQEALRAAAVFARAGQTEIQIQENVRAALLASKIAELDVVQAAELLSSAMYQFDQSSIGAINVLDQLNTLSNNYRVTTNDLLQSISRTGSVFANHNSRLSELAATTAVTAQVTSRSGAEIGNAMKTIVSQLDRVETKRAILEKLNVSVHGVGGTSKNYTQILLELALATQKSTDAERNQLSIQIAGVRQRNILLAQIRHSIELIKAENLALIGEKEDNSRGSATQEFVQNAGTLISALQRMQAQAIQFAANFGEPIRDAFKDVANIIAGFLKILSSGNLDAKLISQISIVSLLAGGLRVLQTAVTGTNVPLITYTKNLIANTIAIYQNAYAASTSTSATFRAVAGFRAVAAAAIQSTGALIAAAGPYIALGAAIYLVVGALGEYAEAEQIASEVQRSRSENLDRDIAKEANRAKAIRNSAQAIITIALEIERLREEERKFGVDNSKFIASLNDQAKQIETSAGLTGAPRKKNGDVSAEGTESKRFEEERKSAQREIDLLRERAEDPFLKINKETQLDQAEQARKRLQSNVDFNQSHGFLNARFPRPLEGELKPPSAFEGAQGTFLTPGASSETRLQKQLQAIEELKREISDIDAAALKASDRIKELQGKLEGYVKAAREAKELNVSFNRLVQTNARDREVEPIRAGTLATTTADHEAHGLDEIDKIEKRRVESLRIVNRLLDLQIADVDQLQDAQKQLDHLTDRSLKLQLDKYQEIRKIQKDAVTDQLNVRSKLTEGAGAFAFAKERGLDPAASSFGDALADNDAKRELLRRTIDSQLKQSEEIKAGKVKGSPDELASASESLKLKTQEDLNRLRDLEVEKALALFEAEKNIAIERKKSADEALRAVGALGDEDKLRVLAQAQFFAKNPKAKISAEDQFGMSSEDNSTLQRFFGSKLEDFSTDKSKFKDFLGSAGFGVSADVSKGEAELASRRAGRTDSKVIEDADSAAANISRQSGVLSGSAARTGAIKFATSGAFGTGGAGGGSPTGTTINAEIKNSAVNFEPLLKSLEVSNAKLNQESIDAASKRFEKIVDERIRASSRVRNAAVAPPAAGGV